jgi:hypothetical protein
MTGVCSSVLYVHTAYNFALSSFIQITNEIGTDFDQFFWHTSTILIYITYLLTPWSRVLLEKLTGSAASQEILRLLWNP